MPDKSRDTLTFTRDQFDELIQSVIHAANDFAKDEASTCAAGVLDRYAEAIETASVQATSPEARAGADAALRSAAQGARTFARQLRTEATQKHTRADKQHERTR